MSLIYEKLKTNVISVLPIFIVVIILNFTLVKLSSNLLFDFVLSSILIIIGLTLFLTGIDLGITPLGHHTGNSIAKSNKISVVIIAGLILGFFISIAEPGLMVIANQVDTVTNGNIASMLILVTVSVGLAIMLVIGFMRIFYNLPLYIILIVLYAIIFILSLFTSSEFLAISFDSSGATTGILAVPFILSLESGISALKKDSKSSEKDSFGLIAIASTGAIIAVMLLNIFSKEVDLGHTESVVALVEPSLWSLILANAKDAVFSLLPLLVIFLLLQKKSFKLKKKSFRRMINGFVYSFLGITLFFIGINSGFMEVASQVGNTLALRENKFFTLIVAFAFGFVTIMAEPAVYVLTSQIEEVTSGYIKRKLVLFPLAIGVGIAVLLSAVRILTSEIQLWHYLLPGYFIAILLTFFSPKLFVGIAFDAGGVATGPMTATFILAFTQGIANSFESSNVLVDGFGMISMVALIPIITLQILGIMFKIKSNRRKKNV